MNKEILSVCIATYKRQELLKKLLISIINQKGLENYIIEIIVVDNDVNRSAETVVLEFRENFLNKENYILKYDMQPEKNIAITRNRTIELASGEYLFFIDDDEYADENCIYNHIITLKKFNAVATIGSVLPYFSANIPNYLKNCYIYIRENSEDGAPSDFFITGNALVNKSFIEKYKINFDKNYGLTGGEDNDFFTRINALGGKIISCGSAYVYEFIPDEKVKLNALIKRVFRTGNNYTRTVLSSNKKFRLFLSIEQFCRGIIQALMAFIFSILFFWNRSKRLNWFLKSISNLAKPFAVLGYYPKGYKK